MSNNMQPNNVNVNFLFSIGVVLVILKLAEVAPVAEWSWLLVTMPFYAHVVFALIALPIFLIIGHKFDDEEFND